MLRLFITLAFVADITLKFLVRQHPAVAGRFAFWTPVGPIGIVPSTNDVLAFSFPVPNAWIWPIGWVVVAVLLWKLRRISLRKANSSREENFKFQIPDRRVTAITAIIFGAISNLIDRTFFGGVTDYLSLTNLFPAFNISDLLILGGLAAWLWSVRHVVGNS